MARRNTQWAARRGRHLLGARSALLLGILGALGCGGGSSGQAPAGTPHDFSGLWVLQVTETETDCGDGLEVHEPYLTTIEQSGSALTVTTPLGRFEGTVVGDTATVGGTYPDGLGFTTFVGWVLTAEGGGFSGGIDWTFSFDESGVPVECEGTSTAVGVPAPPPVTVEFAPLPSIESGTPIDLSLSIDGGCGGPYQALLSQGSLPQGVSVGAVEDSSPPGGGPAVRISGVPHLDGLYDFSVLVSDPACAFAPPFQVHFTWLVQRGPVRILDCDPPVIPVAEYAHPLKYPDVDALADRIFNNFGVHDLLVVAGTPPYRCEVLLDPDDPDDGPLPLGLSIPPDSCAMVGAPIEVGPSGRPFRLTIRATDALGETATRKFQLAVLTPAIVIATSSLPDATQGVPYSETIQVVDGVPPFTFSISAGSLPDGLAIDSGTGDIGGTPTTPGTSTFTVKVEDLAGGEATKEFDLTVN